MTIRRRNYLLTTPLVLLALSCSSDDSDPVDAAPAIDALIPVDATPAIDATPVCGATDLCKRSINECSVDLTQPECEAWYAEPSNCLNFPAYTTCNCACIDQATCDGYFACGTICFEDHCS